MTDKTKPQMAQQGRGPKKAGIGNLPGKKKDDIKFIEDADGNKIFIKTIEMGKDGIQTVDMKAKGGRVTLRGGGICKRGMNKKARGANS